MKTLLFFFLFTGIANAQSSFKINTKVDEFTGEKSIITSYFAAGWKSGIDLDLAIYQAGGNTYLVADLETDNVESVDTDDKLMIKLEDNTVISLQPIESAISDIKGLDDIHLMAVYQISESDFYKLTQSPMALVRVETRERNYDLPPLKKKDPGEAMANFDLFYKKHIQ